MAGDRQKGKASMLRNHRGKIPYAITGVILLCMAVLAFLEIRGVGTAEETPYIFPAAFHDDGEESLPDDAACGEEKPACPGYRIEGLEVTELSAGEVSAAREGADGLKTQYVEPVPTPEPAPVPAVTPEPVPEPTAEPAVTGPVPAPKRTEEPALAPEPTPGASLLPGPAPIPAPADSTPQLPVAAPADVNEQSFQAPLTGVPMSVTVTLGTSGASSVTLACPDGTVLGPAAVDGNVSSFYTTAQPGSYVVVTTGYSTAGSVSVHVHCGS